MDIQIEALNSDNLLDLKDLYKAVFGNEVNAEYLRHKFDTSYLGVKHFGHLAYHKGKPIAFHGAIPMLMQYENRTEIAAQYGDAMTLKNYWGKGLFTRLGRLTDEQLRAAGVRFVWGFPNQNSEYGYLNKMNWKYVERMQGFKIKTAPLPVEKIARKNKKLEQLYTKRLEQSLSAYRVDKVLKGSVFQQEKVLSTCRNKAYYDYKSFTNNFVLAIADCFFWVKIKYGILVGDIEAPSEKQFSKALQTLKEIALKNGIGAIIIQTSPNTPIMDLMKKQKAERFQSWIVGFNSFNSHFPMERLKLTYGDLDTF
jgi:hypothetical protein